MMIMTRKFRFKENTMRKITVTIGILVYLFACYVFIEQANAGELPEGATCRSQNVKHQFDVYKGYPNGRKGFVVDHICALECGGFDAIVNMQYQDKEDSLLKDRWERTKSGCALTCNSSNSTKTRQVFNCK
jgi:hypothetical protein